MSFRSKLQYGLLLAFFTHVYLGKAGIKTDLQIDSLKNEIEATSSDSLKAHLHLQLSKVYMDLDFDLMRLHAEIAEQKSKMSGSKLLMAESVRQIGISHMFKGQLEVGTSRFKEAYLLVAQEKDTALMARSAMNIGIGLQQIGKPDSAILWYDTSLALFEALGDYKSMVAVYNNLAGVHNQLGDLKESIKTLTLGIQLSKEHNAPVSQARLLSNLGITLIEIGSTSDAIKYLSEGLELALQLEKTALAGDFYANIALAYQNEMKLEKALESLVKALDIYEQTGHEVGLAHTLGEIGEVYIQMNRLEAAEDSLKKAYDLINKTEALRQKAAVNLNLGELYLAKENFDQALDHFSISLEIFKNVEENKEITSTNNKIGKVMLLQGNYSKAFDILQSSRTVSADNDWQLENLEALRLLLDLHIAQRDYKKAFEYQASIDSLKDILNDKRRLTDLENVTLRYELSEQERVNDHLSAQQASQAKLLALKEELINQKNIFLWVCVIGIGITVLAAMSYYRKNKYKHILNEKLMSFNTQIKVQNEQLRKSEQSLERKVEERTKELNKFTKALVEKNNKLEEFAFFSSHVLRAPLASLRGLFNLTSGRQPIDEECLGMINKEVNHLLEVVNDLNRIIETMPDTKKRLEWVEFEPLVDKIIARFKGRDIADGIRISKNIQLDKIYSVRPYLESIMHELIENAIKFSMQDKAEITITAIETENEYSIGVSDSGVGLNISSFKEKLFKPYQRFHIDRPGKGLGLYLVKNQIDQLNGDVILTENPTGGIKVKLGFKKTQKAVA